ncbi:hypothetical protein AS156_32810 [Bradyrhizobium macuxiense]|uniref:Uncharacterized protein n=1 Tax=Bradyrhizobium macuxiense TaxID=1755647 RepID=A0A120FQR7_9BRAD|nr:hypothetical protein [Bradyrhizobium macuxiense]KWV58972.1 hypothetical protein AS156_32810 [Bradyrhizobium macuxiense]
MPDQSADLWDVSGENHDAALLLREPYRDRIRTFTAAAVALAATFALGWAGGLSWHDFTGTPRIRPIAQREVPTPHVAELKPRSEGTRRSAAASEPLVTGSIPKTNARLPAMAAAPTTVNTPPVALAMKQPLAPAPETRPTTIPGWSVVEVRDGTAVLEGPEGVRMAARGDVVPGLGRVDSIVRWGNRWIVATASGLVATP